MSNPAKNLPRVADIAAALEDWAPRGSAQSYDNVGLQIGRPQVEVRVAIVALEVTPEVLDEAERAKAELIICHHPLIFRPLRNLTPGDLPSVLALRMAEKGIALYTAHTNLDAAPGGVSFALAEALGLSDVKYLKGMADTLYKLVTFVPGSHIEAVREALGAAGAGHIGDYTDCAFGSEGTGYFRAGAGTNPFTGSAGGGVEQASEIRLEVEVPRWNLGRVLSALRGAHPYEEVAYDVYPVAQENSRAGMGAVGVLEAPEPLEAFLRRVAVRLDAAGLRYTGNPDAQIRRVAVCGGAGSDLIAAARGAGADAFVTADVSYHRFFETTREDGTCGMAVVDAGHYETEAMTEPLIRDFLAARFPATDFRRTEVRTSPVRFFSR